MTETAAAYQVLEQVVPPQEIVVVGGAVSVAAFDTVTMLAADVALFPAASDAFAVRL